MSSVFQQRPFGVNLSLLSQPRPLHPMASVFWSVCVTPWCWPGNSQPSSEVLTSPATLSITVRSSMVCQGSGTRPTSRPSVRGPTGWGALKSTISSKSDRLMSNGLHSCADVCRCQNWRRTGSTSSRCELLTWRVLASHRCPATPSCVRSGPSQFQVSSSSCNFLLVTTAKKKQLSNKNVISYIFLFLYWKGNQML